MRTLSRFILLLSLLLGLARPAMAQDAGVDQDADAVEVTAPADSSGGAIDAASPAPAMTTPVVTPAASQTPVPTSTPTAAPTSTPASATPNDVAARSSPSVVEVLTEAGQGSGVAVHDGILTAAHVVQDAVQIKVVTGDHRQAPASVVRIDPGADLALLQTSLSVPPLDLDNLASQHTGDPVLVLGYVGNGKDDSASFRVGQGQLSAIGKDPKSGAALVQTNAESDFGESGGPMVNMGGKLIGVNSFHMVVGSVKTHFSIGSDTVYAFLALPAAKVAPPPPSPAYRGDPRNLVLTSAYLGNGWVQDLDDRGQLAQGEYWAGWHLKTTDPSAATSIRVGAVVLPSAAAVDAVWEHPELIAPTDTDYQVLGQPKAGEDGMAWINTSGTSIYTVVRERNVILFLAQHRDAGLSVDQLDAVVGMLSWMANQVNSQSK